MEVGAVEGGEDLADLQVVNHTNFPRWGTHTYLPSIYLCQAIVFLCCPHFRFRLLSVSTHPTISQFLFALRASRVHVGVEPSTVTILRPKAWEDPACHTPS